MTRIRLAPSGAGVTLIEFDETFDYPSEVYRLAPEHSTITRIYRDKHHAVSDIALGRDGWTYLAGVQRRVRSGLPVPGKVRILGARTTRHGWRTRSTTAPRRIVFSWQPPPMGG